MSLFSGRGKRGFGKIEKLDTNEAETKNAEVKKEETVDKSSSDKSAAVKPAAAKPKVEEADLLFDKTYTCPVCEKDFKAKTIRTGKIKLLSQDTDLRPKYQNVDSLKYDALACPICGYAALSRFFKFVMPSQVKFITEKISNNFGGLPQTGGAYTYDDAIVRYELAIENAEVKQAKASEKAYTCLKTAWIYRGKAEALPEDTPDYDKVVKELNEKEQSYIEVAYAGFDEAYMKEDFPLCGMDEPTFSLLVADLARRVGKFEESSRWISKVLTSRMANDRTKEKARDIKELIDEEKKSQQE